MSDYFGTLCIKGLKQGIWGKTHSLKIKMRSDEAMVYWRVSLKQSLQENFEPTIGSSNIENKPSHWTQRKISVETFVNLTVCSIYSW